MKAFTGLAAAMSMGLAMPVAAAAADAAAPVAGVWQATADIKGVEIPFRLAIEGEGEAVRAHFFDGPRATNSASEGSLVGDHLHLVFPSYSATIEATVTGGVLDGAYATPTRSIPIHAVKAAPATPAAGPAPAIAGEWIIPLPSDPQRPGKGEAAWRLIIKQTGDHADAAILRVDGDTGDLDGRYQDGAFRLSHFAGERPALLEITPQPDHTLKLVLKDGDERDLTAIRPALAAKQGIAPTDPTRHTTVANKAEPFRFAFRDLDGRLISNADARFRHKVVVVDIMGSWCPNCHDEAPFLQALYEKHHKDGLEVVALDFEQRPDQVTDPKRLRAFIARYGLTYTVLLAGETKDVHEKLPQAANLNAWPTTFFIGRDGLVKATHVGFTSPASGPRDLETRREVERQVVALLAQRS
jgi:thiol-disulfide isomerase/thioredoxin